MILEDIYTSISTMSHDDNAWAGLHKLAGNEEWNGFFSYLFSLEIWE